MLACVLANCKRRYVQFFTWQSRCFDVSLHCAMYGSGNSEIAKHYGMYSCKREGFDPSDNHDLIPNYHVLTNVGGFVAHGYNQVPENSSRRLLLTTPPPHTTHGYHIGPVNGIPCAHGDKQYNHGFSHTNGTTHDFYLALCPHYQK